MKRSVTTWSEPKRFAAVELKFPFLQLAHIILDYICANCPLLNFKFKMPDWLSAVIGGGASVINNLLGFGANYQQNKYNKEAISLQNQYNRELAAYQNSMNLEQWNRENAYNTPTAQITRLREAGINPHLAYSHGSISNTSASSPQLTAGEQSAFRQQAYQADIQQGVNNYIALKKLDNETKLVDSQIYKNETSGRLNEENAVREQFNNEMRNRFKNDTHNAYQSEQERKQITRDIVRENLSQAEYKTRSAKSNTEVLEAIQNFRVAIYGLKTLQGANQLRIQDESLKRIRAARTEIETRVKIMQAREGMTGIVGDAWTLLKKGDSELYELTTGDADHEYYDGFYDVFKNEVMPYIRQIPNSDTFNFQNHWK